MARQYLQAASKGFGTLKITDAGGIADASLISLIATALSTTVAKVDARITGCNLRIVAATTFYWENDGTAADANAMPYSVGDELVVPKNNYELLRDIHIVTTGNTDLRVMLW